MRFRPDGFVPAEVQRYVPITQGLSTLCELWRPFFAAGALRIPYSFFLIANILQIVIDSIVSSFPIIRSVLMYLAATPHGNLASYHLHEHVSVSILESLYPTCI